MVSPRLRPDADGTNQPTAASVAGRERRLEVTQATPTSHDNAVHDGAVTATQRFVELQGRLLALYGVSATSRFLELAKPRMRAHVLDAGEGEPVLLYHGGDGEAVNWAPLMAQLQGSARVIAADRPGFGLSDPFDYRTVDLRQHAADFTASLLDALGIESVTLVGGSMGGFFALAAAAAFPERVRRLVLVGLAPGAISEIPDSLRAITANPELAAEFMKGRDSLEAQHSQYRDLFHVDPATVPELYFETRIAGLRLPSEHGTWATLLPRVGDPGLYFGDDLARITTPSLVIWGEHDMAPVVVGQRIAAELGNGRLVAMPGVAHFPFLEAPEQTANIITSFMRE
jgi:pimeloyl-ACP methyl ester carboxylesterase